MKLVLGLAVVLFSVLGLTQLTHRFEFSDLAQGEGAASQAYRLLDQEFGTELIAEFRLQGPKLPSLPVLRDWVQQERLSHTAIQSLMGPWQLGHFKRDGPRIDFVFPDSSQHFTPDLARFFGSKESEQFRFFVGFWNDSERPFRAETLRRFEKALLQKLRDFPGVHMEVVGPAAFAAEAQESTIQDERLNVLAALFVLGLSILLWKSIRLGVLLLATLILSSGVVLGLMGWFGAPLDSVSSILLIVIAFASLEDFVFLVHSGRVTGRIDRAAFRRIWIPCLLTSVTTAEGFLALLTSDLSMIGRFGLWVAVGAFVEWMIVFGLLPPLLEKYPSWGVVPQRSLPRWSRFQFPKWVAWILLVTPFVALWLAPPLKSHVDPFELFSKESPLRRSALAEQDTRQILGLYESTEDSKTLLQELRTQPGVTSVVSSHSIMDLWVSRLINPSPELLQWVQRQWSQVGVSERFESSTGVQKVFIQVESKHSDAFHQWAKSQTQIRLTNDYWVYAEFAELVMKTLKDSTWLALILVGALVAVMAMLLGQWRAIPKLIVCAFWGPVSMLALCCWAQIPVTVNLAPFAAVLMGLSGDNAIQFLYFSRQNGGIEKASHSWGRASIEVSVFMLALASLPLLSAFEPAGMLALFLMGGVVMALVGEFYLLSSLGPKDA